MHHLPSQPTDEGATVLVAVMNNRTDFARAREEGWYRIPVAKAPKPLASDYLAFYLTSAFEEERWSVPYIAEVWRYEIRRRREMIPAEAAHPRANDLYYCLRLGPVEALECPVPARAVRRVTFIRTTLACLLAADDVRELWLRSAPARPPAAEHIRAMA